MKIDWDPEVDTPATIAVIGGGPLGVEAALYARFLGYFVMLFDRRKVGNSLLAWHDSPFVNASQSTLSQATRAEEGAEPKWRDCTTPLGLAALEAQAGASALPPPDESVTYRKYVEQYLLPVARTDLLYESTHVHSQVISISRVGCSSFETCSLERRSEQEFRLLINSKNRGEFTQLADIVLDCSGTHHLRRGLATGGGRAIGESLCASQMILGKCDILGKHRTKFAGKHSMLFGSNYEACANALEFLQLARDVPSTKLTWVIPKRIGTKGFPLASGFCPTQANPPAIQDVLDRALHAIDNELTHLIPLAAWGIEAIHFDEATWSIKLQSTEEETLELSADMFLNCADNQTDQSYRADMLVHTDNTTEATPAITLTQEPHYYQLGQRAVGHHRICTLEEGFQQIRDTFAKIGGRQELNLYATVKPQGK